MLAIFELIFNVVLVIDGIAAIGAVVWVTTGRKRHHFILKLFMFNLITAALFVAVLGFIHNTDYVQIPISKILIFILLTAVCFTFLISLFTSEKLRMRFERRKKSLASKKDV